MRSFISNDLLTGCGKYDLFRNSRMRSLRPETCDLDARNKPLGSPGGFFCVLGVASGGLMAKAGRKRKAGERHDCGRLKVVRDIGCEGVQRRRAMYGRPPSPANDEDHARGPDFSQTFDAIGRAWSSDLLDRNPDRARELMDGARKIAAQYWRVYGFGTSDSLAKMQPSHAFGIADPERDRIREDALNDALDMVNKKGREVRKAFDQLIIELNPDEGPHWLDRIIASRRGGPSCMRGDFEMLSHALIGLKAVA